tara:strand:- start:5672 stop:6337 length:666 start_codon:yes stop_codon:yes gene_type:complete
MKSLELKNFSKHFFSITNGTSVLFHNQNIRFEEGKNIGLMGVNGCGKTTLLRILSRSESISSGEFSVNGTISWPIGVYAGLDPFLTGRQNVLFIASLLGINEKDDLAERVASLAELRDSMDLHVRFYSSGMFSRLSFFLCMLINFDFYLIDEVTSVGDAGFQKKSSELLSEVSERSTIILTSHNADNIRQHCELAYVIVKGKISHLMDVNEAIDYYHKTLE